MGFVSVRQIVKDLLHTLPVLPESSPTFVGEVKHGVGLLAFKFLLDLNVARFFQFAQVRRQVAPRQPGLAHQEGKVPLSRGLETTKATFEIWVALPLQ